MHSSHPALRIRVVPTLHNPSEQVGVTNICLQTQLRGRQRHQRRVKLFDERPFRSSQQGDRPAVKDNNHDDPKLELQQIF